MSYNELPIHISQIRGNFRSPMLQPDFTMLRIFTPVNRVDFCSQIIAWHSKSCATLTWRRSLTATQSVNMGRANLFWSLFLEQLSTVCNSQILKRKHYRSTMRVYGRHFLSSGFLKSRTWFVVLLFSVISYATSLVMFSMAAQLVRCMKHWVVYHTV